MLNCSPAAGRDHDRVDIPIHDTDSVPDALKERFGQIARTDRRYRLDELQRQFAYDRALARLFTSPEADHWVLKGAGALLARLTTARHSKDLDVFLSVNDADAERAVNALRTALRLNLSVTTSPSISPVSHRCRKRQKVPESTSTHDLARPHSPASTSTWWWALS